MKSFSGILVFALLVAYAEAQTPAHPPNATPTPTPGLQPGKRVPLTYKPPENAKAAPRDDVDAGSRGWNATMPSLYVLAPNHTGLTTREQPTLFWYQSGPTSTRIELTIIEPKNPTPLLRVAAERVQEGGIFRLPLKRHNVTLVPGVVYKWTVVLVVDPANRSQDIIASDTIQLVEPGAQLAAALAGRKGVDLAAVYASNGIWYDTLEAVANAIDAAPKDKEIRLLRASLLDQAGLKQAAASERR